MTINKFILLIDLIITCGLTSCKKGLPIECYDKVYHEKHKDDICFTDCPGVTGCDGKFYCNECGMHANGIKKTQ